MYFQLKQAKSCNLLSKSYGRQIARIAICHIHATFSAVFSIPPVYGDAHDDVAGEEESEDAEEGADPAQQVAAVPRHRRVPTDLQGHHQESHLENTL